jgi:6-pyruvoyltetrahydropterin/6-carboxytetrahydropterin synthase
VAFGKCNNPYGHGHNYTVEAIVGGPVDAATGMVMNLTDLDLVVQKEILHRFDHANLNLDPAFAGRVPTTENFCRTVYALLQGALPKGSLETVRVEETENNFFEYCGQE